MARPRLALVGWDGRCTIPAATDSLQEKALQSAQWFRTVSPRPTSLSAPSKNSPAIHGARSPVNGGMRFSIASNDAQHLGPVRQLRRLVALRSSIEWRACRALAGRPHVCSCHPHASLSWFGPLQSSGSYTTACPLEWRKNRVKLPKPLPGFVFRVTQSAQESCAAGSLSYGTFGRESAPRPRLSLFANNSEAELVHSVHRVSSPHQGQVRKCLRIIAGHPVTGCIKFFTEETQFIG
jgi:hypothetical protein